MSFKNKNYFYMNIFSLFNFQLFASQASIGINFRCFILNVVLERKCPFLWVCRTNGLISGFFLWAGDKKKAPLRCRLQSILRAPDFNLHHVSYPLQSMPPYTLPNLCFTHTISLTQPVPLVHPFAFLCILPDLYHAFYVFSPTLPCTLAVPPWVPGYPIYFLPHQKAAIYLPAELEICNLLPDFPITLVVGSWQKLPH